MSSAYREKISKLQQDLKKCGDSLAASESSVSTLMICAIIVPIIIFLGLYFIQPNIVAKKENGKQVRNIKAILLWTTGLTVAIWAGMYCYQKYFSCSAPA